MTIATTPTTTTITTATNNQTLLEIRDLCVDYRAGKNTVPVVRDVSLDIMTGDSMAIVGESGCGKTTLALALLRLLPRVGIVRSGSVRFRTRAGTMIDLLTLHPEALRQFRWTEASVVFQGSMNALNPLTRIGSQFADTARAHGTTLSSRALRARAGELLEMVKLEPARVLPAFPHELSGGMRQRVLIALSLLLRPQLVILDEPTTALDILTQRSIVDLLTRLRSELEFSMVFVTHDLALAAELAERVATMYGGRIVELADVRDTFYRPQHPYTIGLIKAVPPVTGELPRIASIPGFPPRFGNLPTGCSFHPRCPLATDVCVQQDPPLEQVAPRHSAACHHAGEMSIERDPVSAHG
ncbi:MAG: ABC transporter ATP-binding protein [Nakamurella sp.]